MNITIVDEGSYNQKGSVIKGLAKELNKKGHRVSLFMPLVREEGELRLIGRYFVRLPLGSIELKLFSNVKEGISRYYIKNEKLFSRSRPWGFHDDALRSCVLCLGALEGLEYIGLYPELILTFSDKTAAVPILLKLKYSWISGFSKTKAYHHINRTSYPVYDLSVASSVFGVGGEDLHILRVGNDIDLIKGGIICANRVFVGENAAELLYSNTSRLHHTVLQFGFKLRKLQLGIDYDCFSPENDKDIYKSYSSDSLYLKFENKLALQKYCGMTEDKDIPMVAIYPDRNRSILRKNLRDMLRCDMQLFIFKENVRNADLPSPSKKCVIVDSATSETFKRIFSACDFSVFGGYSSETANPCYISCAYGCVPIVPTHRFYDIGISYFNKMTLEGNGYTYNPDITGDMLYTLWDGLGVYRHDPKTYSKLVRNTTEKVFSPEKAVECLLLEAEKTDKLNI